MPFIVNILLKIFSAIDSNWERFGNLIYSITYKPTNDNVDGNKIRDRVNIIIGSFNDVMDAVYDKTVGDKLTFLCPKILMKKIILQLNK